MSELQTKTVLITGGGSGIGLATARMFLAEGACVAIAGRDAAKLRRAAEALDGGGRLFYHAADVSEPDQVAELVGRVRDRFQALHILVNNAGLNIKERSFHELTPESWRLLVKANLDSAFYCARAVLPGMLEQGDGLIVNVNSVAGKRASPLGGAGYAAAKFGMSALATCLAEEVRGQGVRVSTIYPGEVDTPILENRPKPVTPEQRRLILRPEDVAAAVLFVATLPPRASVPELVIKPTAQGYI